MRKNKSKLTILMLSIASFSLISCNSEPDLTSITPTEKSKISEICKNSKVTISDVFKYFGESIGGGDPLHGLYYEGEDGFTYIFEYDEQFNEDDVFNKSAEVSPKTQILAIYRYNENDGEQILEQLWVTEKD